MKKLKRIIDIFGAMVGLILFSPLLLVFAVLIKIMSPGPILFKHNRLGEEGKTIKIYKFRTMVENSGQILKEMLDENPAIKEEYETTYKIKNDPRVTPLGRWLRKTSMDELPQFFNILRGDISLVGPRPIVKSELTKYGAFAATLLQVKPGLTGLWQISGRNDLDYSERVELDMEYIKHWSIWLDIKILARTIPAVLSRRGAR